MLKSSVSTTKLFARTGTPELHSHFFSMKSDRVIESAIRAAQNLLWQNLPPTHPDAAAVARLRDLVRSPAVKTVLLHSNDTFRVASGRICACGSSFGLIARSSIISGTFLTIRTCNSGFILTDCQAL